MIGYFTSILGSFMYNQWFRDKEFTSIMILAVFLNFFGAVATLFFVTGHYFGISPFLFSILTSTIFDTLFICLMTLPLSVLYVRLIPRSIEASMYALLTGLANFSELFLNKQLGNFFNLFVGVTTDSMNKIWVLYTI